MNIKQTHKGFTLIEIMIALVIGVFLTAGASQIFLSTNQSNRMQENLSRMQENARFAMNYLTEDIRQADFKGGQCVKGVLATANNHILPYSFDVSDGISAAEGSHHPTNSALDAPDAIGVWRIHSGNGVLIDQDVSGAAAIKIKADIGLKNNDLVLLSDCSVGDIFKVTNFTSATLTVLHSTAPGTPGTPQNNSANVANDYLEAAKNAKLYYLSGSGGNQRTIYSIDASTGALQRGSDDLVDNIENMQIVYGVKSGNTIYYAPYSGAMNMDNVISVRVSLLVRSPDDNLTATPKTYTYNGASTTPTDKRLRKVYTSTITVRNRLP